MTTLAEHLAAMLPPMSATIERRVFVTYRADPDALRPLVPRRFDLRLTDGYAVGGVCLLRLGNMRPERCPRWIGVRSENAAHRISIVGPHGDDSIWAPRRDTDSRIVTMLGRAAYPGSPGRARFDVTERDQRIRVGAFDADAQQIAAIDATLASQLPSTSLFADVEAVRAYYRSACSGYSPGRSDGSVDHRVDVAIDDWTVQPLVVASAASTVFDPLVDDGRAELDHAVMMTGPDSTWHLSR